MIIKIKGNNAIVKDLENNDDDDNDDDDGDDDEDNCDAHDRDENGYKDNIRLNR